MVQPGLHFSELETQGQDPPPRPSTIWPPTNPPPHLPPLSLLHIESSSHRPPHCPLLLQSSVPPPDLELAALSFRKHRSQMHRPRSQMAPCCVTQDKSLTFSVPQHPHLYYEANDRTYHAGLLRGLHDESIDNALKTEWPVHTISCLHLNMVDSSLFTFIVTFSEKSSLTPSQGCPPIAPSPSSAFIFFPTLTVIRIRVISFFLYMSAFCLSPPECQLHKSGDFCLLCSSLIPQCLAQG